MRRRRRWRRWWWRSWSPFLSVGGVGGWCPVLLRGRFALDRGPESCREGRKEVSALSKRGKLRGRPHLSVFLCCCDSSVRCWSFALGLEWGKVTVAFASVRYHCSPRFLWLFWFCFFFSQATWFVFWFCFFFFLVVFSLFCNVSVQI